MKESRGFVLISVLLITTIASMLAFSAIAENRLQEKTAGAHKKGINARMKAEDGIFSGFYYIQEQHQLAILEADEIASNLMQYVQEENTLGGFKILEASVDNGLYRFVSKGRYHGATAYLKTAIKANALQGNSGFTDAIIGCEGIVLNGSGAIDSFNSSKGAYKASFQENGQTVINQNSNAQVSTLGIKSDNGDGQVTFQGADVTLSGDAPILGDVNVTGNFVSSGSAHIDGNLQVNGNVDFQAMNADSPGSSHIITGDVSLGGDADINSNTIGGNMQVAGFATDTQHVDGTVSYGELGGIYGDSHLTLQDSAITGPNLAMSDCDTMNLLPTMINNGNPIAEPDVYTGMKKQLTGLYDLETLVFQTDDINKQAQVLSANTTDGTTETINTQEMYVLGRDTPTDVFVFEDFHLRSRLITIKGDVTLVVKGDFETSGDASGFQFEAGDTSSSLTIITEGSVKIGSDSSLFAGAQSLNSNVPLSIYSSYDSALHNKDAVLLAGNTDAYARVYAPKGDVVATNSGHIMGAVHGKTVEVSGAGGIHYDEALLDVADITDEQAGVVQFVSLHYHYN